MTTNDEEREEREGPSRPRLRLKKIRGGDDYLPVAQRVTWFRYEYPHGRMRTEVHALDSDVAIFKATVEDGEGG